MKLPAFFEEDREAVDAALERLLPPAAARPASIHEALRYSVFAGGKRVRPILCLESARIFSGDIAPVLLEHGMAQGARAEVAAEGIGDRVAKGRTDHAGDDHRDRIFLDCLAGDIGLP